MYNLFCDESTLNQVWDFNNSMGIKGSAARKGLSLRTRFYLTVLRKLLNNVTLQWHIHDYAGNGPQIEIQLPRYAHGM